MGQKADLRNLADFSIYNLTISKVEGERAAATPSILFFIFFPREKYMRQHFHWLKLPVNHYVVPLIQAD